VKPVNEAELPFAESSHGERFAHRRKRLSLAAGGKEIGCSLYEITPGKRAFPMHAHMANEEAIFVLEGEGSLRLPGGEVPLRAGDYLAFPAGPDSAHQVHNTSKGTLRFLGLSTMKHPEVVLYTDSQKVMVMAGRATGAVNEKATLEAVLPLGARTGYWDGEE
jgi:uncharacterized cupin superfamily protein